MNELTLTTVTAVCKLFIMMLVGMIAAKAGLLTKKVSDGLTDVLVYLITPLNVFSAFLGGYDPQKAHGMMLSLYATVFFYVIALAAGWILAPKGRPNAAVERICIAFANTGFIGQPVVYTLFGAEGVMYVAVQRIIFTLVFYTYGVMLLEGEFSKEKLKKAVLSPVVILALLGTVVYMARIPVPAFLAAPITSIGDCATPMAMLVCGGIVARSDMKAVIKRPRAYMISAVRLIVLPLLTLVFCKLLSMPTIVSLTAVIVAGCPIGTTCVFFAEKYGQDSAYVSGMFGITTLACMVTMPLLAALF